MAYWRVYFHFISTNSGGSVAIVGAGKTRCGDAGQVMMNDLLNSCDQLKYEHGRRTTSRVVMGRRY